MCAYVGWGPVAVRGSLSEESKWHVVACYAVGSTRKSVGGKISSCLEPGAAVGVHTLAGVLVLLEGPSAKRANGMSLRDIQSVPHEKVSERK